jgi:hypothetical protein
MRNRAWGPYNSISTPERETKWGQPVDLVSPFPFDAYLPLLIPLDRFPRAWTDEQRLVQRRNLDFSALLSDWANQCYDFTTDPLLRQMHTLHPFVGSMYSRVANLSVSKGGMFSLMSILYEHLNDLVPPWHKRKV